jgi:hypothetical protein
MQRSTRGFTLGEAAELYRRLFVDEPDRSLDRSGLDEYQAAAPSVGSADFDFRDSGAASTHS